MSKEPRDVIGNVIHEGDIVLIFLDKPQAIAKVAKITTGGLVDTGGKQSFGMIKCVSPIDISFMPNGGPLPNMIVVRNPGSEQVLADAIARTGPVIVPGA